MGKSIDFVPFMASKDTQTLILVFTLKTGHSVVLNRHRIFIICCFFLSHIGNLKAFHRHNFTGEYPFLCSNMVQNCPSKFGIPNIIFTKTNPLKSVFETIIANQFKIQTCKISFRLKKMHEYETICPNWWHLPTHILTPSTYQLGQITTPTPHIHSPTHE